MSKGLFGAQRVFGVPEFVPSLELRPWLSADVSFPLGSRVPFYRALRHKRAKLCGDATTRVFIGGDRESTLTTWPESALKQG